MGEIQLSIQCLSKLSMLKLFKAVKELIYFKQ